MENIRQLKNGEPILKIDEAGIVASGNIGFKQDVELSWDQIQSVHCYTYRHHINKISYAFLIVQLVKPERYTESLSDKDRKKVSKAFKHTIGGLVIRLFGVEEKPNYKNLRNKLYGMQTYDNLFSSIDNNLNKYSDLSLINFGYLPAMLSDYGKIIRRAENTHVSASDIIEIRNTVVFRSQITGWVGGLIIMIAIFFGAFIFSSINERYSIDNILISDESKYEGDTIQGMRTGKGREIWENGNIYEGEYLDNERTGKGVFMWADGGRYEGDFIKGVRTGKGVYTWADGAKHEGEFLNDEFTGKGKRVWANGESYEGDWKDNNKHGKGVYTWLDGTRQEGNFLNDKFAENGE